MKSLLPFPARTIGNDYNYNQNYNDQSDYHKLFQIQLSEKLAPFGIIGDKFRVPLKSLEHHSNMIWSGLRRALNWTPVRPRYDGLYRTADIIFSILTLGSRIRNKYMFIIIFCSLENCSRPWNLNKFCDRVGAAYPRWNFCIRSSEFL